LGDDVTVQRRTLWTIVGLVAMALAVIAWLVARELER
jgi:hypothetical protein